ncbi:hypothetical protein J5N97_017020 [Dioscorea zingiberensis]|uniref:Pentatricopeptide repeat-containing protein n=1 Tax=Dioscorea zingiberensis TaxID=325984 RepID=A0A9D5CN25_9LILI|nr:hypothetical protein J5N97_017020 [Dioscorea zingiberensis]
MLTASSPDMAKALELFNEMRSLGIKPNASTLVSIVSSGCNDLMSALKHELPQIQSYGIKVGFHSDLRTMLREGAELDSVALLGVISACVMLGRLFAVCMVYSLLIKCGFDRVQTVTASLVNAYAKCNDAASARRIFDSVPEKDISLWTSMISGYVHVGCTIEALALSENLLATSIKPSKATIATMLSACNDFGSLILGEKVEEYAKASNLILDLQLCTSLIQMYCKCGSIERAKEIFERVPGKDLTLWSTMINGYACHGMGEEALALFNEMQRENNNNIKPDAICFH